MVKKGFTGKIIKSMDLAGQEIEIPQNSSDYFKFLIEHAEDAIAVINPQNGNFEYISPAITKITGFTPEDHYKMGQAGVIERMHPDTKQLVAQNPMSKDVKLSKDYVFHVEMKFKHKDGHYIWLGGNRKLIFDKKGNLKFFIANLRDITEMKHLQEQLELSLQRYKNVYYNANVALFRTRISDGKVIECNDNFAKMIGYKDRQECIEKHYTTKFYVNPQRRTELLQLLKEDGKVENFELETFRVDGSTLWVKLTAQAYSNEDYIEGIFTNITTPKILTPIENLVLKQIMLGKSSKEIAFDTKRSVRTIEDHRANIMSKLGAHNLVELTQKTIEGI